MSAPVLCHQVSRDSWKGTNMKRKNLTLTLVSAGIVTLGAFAVAPTLAGLQDEAKFFDPLFAGGKACAPAQAGVPPLLRNLILAKAEKARSRMLSFSWSNFLSSPRQR